MKEEFILELKNISKTYGATKALSDVTFNVKRGRILSLVGENGAGKSTLLKVFSGVIPYGKYEGTLFFEGQEARFASINESVSKGISIIHQELAISPHLTVCENMYLNNYMKKFGVIQWTKMYEECEKYLKMVGLNIKSDTIAGTLSVAQQQLIEIAKALSKQSKLIFFDEPTSSLNDDDSFKLLDIMKKLRDEKGVTSVFVSHKLNEVSYVADDVVVIRDGKFISAYDKTIRPINEQELIKDIVGRTLEAKFPPKNPNKPIGDVIFEVKNVSVLNPLVSNYYTVKDASFNLRQGEILGISGLVGSGRTELMLSIFGKYYNKIESGTILLRGKEVRFKNPREAIRKGIMYASEDRKNIGLIQMFSIKSNITSASEHIYSKLGVYNINKEEKDSINYSQQMGVKTKNINNEVESLSGGNQQKVVVAKALSTDFDILIIDEPTKGIDVGSKLEIYQLLIELANNGKSIIVISSELEELLGITDRIFVMAQGKIKGEILTKDATQEKIMQIGLL
ncbi:sugar ABC transporter ATP-binding protein [Mycoplasma crocodyli]|uniref:Sugar ABC transporter, ATP-binding protein n=1 Tax=Mycoplasma crocodyli (strain ATCC 51981 / MP145) TaxID=512564 RepID=D5E505_MYCCM|nr:sugar ABC transporter ATP-binding protein [Mycoplasma crocodyli]ADE19512.1 sugar ABC transporter, ATP-binding protein [Mycoplasma crocodyli MP145]